MGHVAWHRLRCCVSLRFAWSFRFRSFTSISIVIYSWSRLRILGHTCHPPKNFMGSYFVHVLCIIIYILSICFILFKCCFRGFHFLVISLMSFSASCISLFCTFYLPSLHHCMPIAFVPLDMSLTLDMSLKCLSCSLRFHSFLFTFLFMSKFSRKFSLLHLILMFFLFLFPCLPTTLRVRLGHHTWMDYDPNDTDVLGQACLAK